MKNIVASVGLVALASSIGAVRGEVSTATPEKPWNISATLRGFYDDNINSAPTKESSTGFQINPGVSVNWGNGQTLVQAGYVYTFRYYDKRPIGNTANYDQDHQFDVLLNHAFNERYQVSVHDSFVVGQEPDMMRATATMSEFQRIPGNNIRNYGTLVLDAAMTPKFGLEIGYGNEFYDYANDGAQVVSNPTIFPPGFYYTIEQSGGVLGASNAGLLNRIVNRPYLEGHWQVAPQTVGVLGAQYEGLNYTADEPITVVYNTPPLGFPGTPSFSDSRNSRSYIGYLGVNHNFLPECSILANLGARYTDYYNEGSTSVNPYAKINFQYTYTTESYLQLGLTYYNAPTDVVQPSPTEGITRGVNAFVVYGSITHRILPDFFGVLTAQFQNSEFQGGAYNDQSEQYYLFGANLRYKFNHYLSADAGYNLDNLTSPIPNRTYNRNRYYIGVTGSY
jgi:hypothetical protein